MKATKALKRLAKIEALMSDVTEKYVTLAPAVRKALRDAMAAVTVAKEAVSLDAPSGLVEKRKVNPVAASVKASSKKAGPAKRKKRAPV
jgi:hypothetical protein